MNILAQHGGTIAGQDWRRGVEAAAGASGRESERRGWEQQRWWRVFSFGNILKVKQSGCVNGLDMGNKGERNQG